jgi:hypothetical protein
MSREDYDAGVKDAIMWVLEFSSHYKPECLAQEMQQELLPNKHSVATTPAPVTRRTTGTDELKQY